VQILYERRKEILCDQHAYCASKVKRGHSGLWSLPFVLIKVARKLKKQQASGKQATSFDRKFRRGVDMINKPGKKHSQGWEAEDRGRN